MIELFKGIFLIVVFVSFCFTDISAESLAELKINTAPEGAEVSIDGSSKGVTPLRIMLEPGWHEIEIEKDSFQTYIKEIDIKMSEKNRISVDLNEITTLKILVRPSDTLVKIDGIQIAEQQDSSFTSYKEYHEIITSLSLGPHVIEGTHPGAIKPKEKRFKLKSNKKKYLEILRVSLFPEFMEEQEYKQEKSWQPWRIGMYLMGTLITASMANQEYAKAVLASESKTEEDEKMLAASSLEEAIPHNKKAEEYGKISNQHYQNYQVGTIIAVIFTSLTVWSWFDEPEPPATLSWKPTFPENGKLGFKYSYSW